MVREFVIILWVFGLVIILWVLLSSMLHVCRTLHRTLHRTQLA